MADVRKHEMRSSMQTVFDNLPAVERQAVLRSWQLGNEWHEVLLTPKFHMDDLLDPEKPIEYQRYRFDLRHLFGERQAAPTVPIVPPKTAEKILLELCERDPVEYLRLADLKSKQAAIERERAQLDAARRAAMFEDMQKRVADGIDAVHLDKLIVRVDKALGPDQAVMVSRDAQGRVLSSVAMKRCCTCGAPDGGLHLGDCPSHAMKAMKPVQVFESNWPYDVPGTGFDVEPPNNTPRGLLCVAPMDHRLGKWGPL